MFRSFFISAIRNLKRNRLYTAINVVGLALGVACCLVIFVIVRYETSFDDYHSKAERIYRVNLYQDTPQGRRFEATHFAPMAATIRREVSGVEEVTGVYCLSSYQFMKERNLFEGKFAFFADEHYFDVFDVTWLAGNRERALSDPNSVVVTKDFADTFLGGIGKAMGSSLILENKLSLVVSGVVATPPPNTDHPYSMLISFPSLTEFSPAAADNWRTIVPAATYVLVNADTELRRIEEQLVKVARKYLDEEMATGSRFTLMSLNDNHDRNYDYSSFNYDFPVPVMIMLSIMAGMIAFIACVNYVNLATAQSLRRAREVGLRKTMGGSRSNLVIQYMCEAFVITLFAVVGGMCIAQMGILKLNELYGGSYLRFNLLNEPAALMFILAITILISLLAGFYPAFVLSGYRPVLALQAQTSTGKSGGLSLRRALVIMQFTGAQILILVTGIMINQVSHFRDRPVGYDPQTVVLIQNLRGNQNHEFDKLRAGLQNINGVVNCAFGNTGNMRAQYYREAGEKHSTIVSFADTSYLYTFGSDLLAGRNLPVDASSNEVVVNESFIRKLGFTSASSAIGDIISLNEEDVVIRGVIEDTYTNPMSNVIDPVILIHNPEKFSAVAVSISTNDIAQTVRQIEKAWNEVYPDYLCKYTFMDDLLARQYGFFNLIFSVLGTASSLAIFIGCLGLYGLVSFMAIQRTREIGIRKVLGATVSNVMTLFTKESAVLIAIAFVLAAPLARLIGVALLMEFPERVTPGMEIFVVTLLSSLAIALTAVAYRSFRAAVQSPVDSLRHL